MEIPEKSPLHAIPTQDRPAGEMPTPPAEPTGGHPDTVERDTVSLTAKGREFNSALHHARGLPDIREERVMRLKRQLEEGSYRVEGQRVAVNMIDETLENNRVLKHIDTTA